MILNILIILALMLYLYFFIFNKRKNIEDHYLRNRDGQNPAWIICRTTYDSKVLKVMKGRLNEKCQQLNDWFYNIYNHALKYLITAVKSNPFPNKEYHLCFYIDAENNYLHTAFDHHVIGGETITRMTYIMAGSRTLIKLPKGNLFTGLGYTPYFLFKKPNKIRSGISHNIPGKMRIFHWELTTSKEGSKYEILYNVLMVLYKKLCKPSRKCNYIVVYLPIAFINSSKNNYNNIGLIWLKFSPKICKSINELKELLYEKRYEIMVSNTALNLRLVKPNNSKSIRTNVDAVISMTYAIDAMGPSTVWSYYLRPDYPLYVAVGTNKQTTNDKLKTNITVTVNTDKFKPSRKMQELKIVDNLIVNHYIPKEEKSLSTGRGNESELELL